MPSPFPGMDPYLEGQLWTTFHTSLANEIARQLSPRLRPRYVALPKERQVVETAAPVRLPTVIPVGVPHVNVEIRDAAARRLVTAIEILSPTNKQGDGREEYLERRRRFLVSSVHLVEIDLLRRGHRPPVLGRLPEAPYYVLVGRLESRPLTDIWPIRLDQPLPAIPVPLLPGDADVPLDLQAALTAVYDGLAYDLLIQYTRPPDVPLNRADSALAAELLSAAGVGA